LFQFSEHIYIILIQIVRLRSVVKNIILNKINKIFIHTLKFQIYRTAIGEQKFR